MRTSDVSRCYPKARSPAWGCDKCRMRKLHHSVENASDRGDSKKREFRRVPPFLQLPPIRDGVWTGQNDLRLGPLEPFRPKTAACIVLPDGNPFERSRSMATTGQTAERKSLSQPEDKRLDPNGHLQGGRPFSPILSAIHRSALTSVPFPDPFPLATEPRWPRFLDDLFVRPNWGRAETTD